MGLPSQAVAPALPVAFGAGCASCDSSGRAGYAAVFAYTDPGAEPSGARSIAELGRGVLRTLARGEAEASGAIMAFAALRIGSSKAEG